jgi:RHS repeat-associated protein
MVGNGTLIRDNVYQADPADPATIDRSEARETVFTYDRAGRELSRTLPEGQTESHDVIAQNDSTNGTLAFMYDGHGSTRALLDAAAAIVQTFAYDAYGNHLTATGLTSATAAYTNLLYSGEWTLPTGLQYLRARYYNPSTGRFNRLDPFAGNKNDPQSLHKYLYTHANPVMGIDPLGNSLTLSQVLITTGIMSTLTGGVMVGVGWWTDSGVLSDVGCAFIVLGLSLITGGFGLTTSAAQGIATGIGTLAATGGIWWFARGVIGYAETTVDAATFNQFLDEQVIASHPDEYALPRKGEVILRGDVTRRQYGGPHTFTPTTPIPYKSEDIVVRYSVLPGNHRCLVQVYHVTSERELILDRQQEVDMRALSADLVKVTESTGNTIPCVIITP